MNIIPYIIFFIKQLKNLGNSVNAINDIQNVLSSMSDFKVMGAGKETIRQLLEATSQYNVETLKLAASKVTLTKAQATELFQAKNLTGIELEQAVATATASTANKEATLSTNNLGLAFQGLGAKIKSTTAAMWTFLTTTPAGWATLAVGAIVGAIAATSAYKRHIEKVQQEIIDKYDEAQSKVKEINDEYASHKKTVEELGSTYERLSKHVNSVTNENIDLSTDEYQEYLDISNELAEAFPILKSTIDENGNAILNLCQNGKTASQDLQELLQTEKDLNNYKISQQLGDIYAGIALNANEAKKAVDEYNKSVTQSSVVLKNLRSLASDSEDTDMSNGIRFTGQSDTIYGQEYYNTIKRAMDDFKEGLNSSRLYELQDFFNIDLTETSNQSTGAYEIYLNTTMLSDSEKEQLKMALREQSTETVSMLNQEVVDAFTKKSAQLENFELSWKDFLPSLVSTMEFKSTYKELDPALQRLASDIVGNLQSSIKDSDAWDEADPYSYVQSNIILPLTKLSDKDINLVSSAYENLLKLDPVNLASSNQDAITEFIATLARLLGKDENELRINLGFEVDDKLIASYNDSIQQSVDKLGGDTKQYETIFNNLGIDTEEEIANWNKVAQECKNATEAKRMYAAQNGISHTEVFDPQTFSESLSSISEIQSLYDDFRENVDDGVDFTFDISDIEELREKFGDVCDSFDEFERLATTAGTSTDELQSGFDKLLTEYVYGSDILEGLNTSTREQIVSQLELNGVENASLIVTEELATAKELAAKAGIDLENATADEIDTFFSEANASGVSATALAQLELTKRLVNGTLINTSSDIDQVIALANAAGASAEVLANLVRAKAALESGGASSMISWAEDYIAQVNSGDVDFGFHIDANMFKAGTSAAKSAGGEAGDAYVEAFERELEALQRDRDEGYINEAQYLERLKALYTRYFANRKEYLDEFRRYEYEYLSGMESLYNSALSAIGTLMDRKISAAQKGSDAAISALKAEQDAAEDAYQAQIDAIEKQINAIEKKKDAYQDDIDAKQKEIDAINDAADARQREIDLQKAQYELERMQNQRVASVYDGEKMVYTQDTSGIRDARENVENAKREIEIGDIEKDISAIEEQIDRLDDKIDKLEDKKEQIQSLMDSTRDYYENLISQTESYWNSIIDNMQAQKDRWAELGEMKEIAQAYSYVQQVFGQLGYTVEDVLSGSGGAFEDFKAKYIAIMSDMNKNTSFQDGLSYASGVAKENFGSIVSTAQDTTSQIAQAFSDGSISEAMTQSVSDGISSAQQELGKMNQLGADASDGFIEGWNGKASELTDATNKTASDGVEAFAEGQDSNSPSKAYEQEAINAIDGLLVGIEGKRQEFIDAIKKLAQDGVVAFGEEFNFENSSLQNSFDSLRVMVDSVAEAVGLGSEGTVGGLSSALQTLSAYSLSDGSNGGIISQFNEFKTAVDNVSSSVGLGDEDSLTSALETHGVVAEETLGDDGSGEIGKFEELNTSVNDVATAIGDGDETTLTGALKAQYAVAEEVVPAQTKFFNALQEVINKARDYIKDIKQMLESMDGKTFTATLNVRGAGGGSTTISSNVNGYARGVKDLKRDELAWTQEDGRELIISPTRNSMLTKLNAGDSVLDTEKTENLFKWAEMNPNNLVATMQYSIPDYSKLASSVTNSNKSINFGDINVTCTGITSQEVAQQVGSAIEQNVRGLYMDAFQYSHKR